MYARYGTNFQDITDSFDQNGSLRWGKSYRHYLKGWLPLDPDAEIVELACGSGRLLHFFKGAGYGRLTGVDISPDQVALSRQVTPNVVQSDVLTFLANHKEQFDLVIALDIIEHLQKPEVLSFLDLCFAALKPCGRLVLQTPNAESPWGSTHRYNDLTHEVCFNPNALFRLLRLVGFSSIEARETGPVPFGYSLISSARSVAWAAIRLGMMLWNLAETGDRGSGIFTRVFLISGVKK
jgi:SAM-dependent methyltransferase